MQEIEQQHLSDGTYYLYAEKISTEEDVEQIIQIVQSIHQGTEPIYIILDLKDNYVLPIRTLASRIRVFYRSIAPTAAPIFIAMIVEKAMIQVMDSILKTLIRRASIQSFTETKRAKQWLMLERLKQQNATNIGEIMREDRQD